MSDDETRSKLTMEDRLEAIAYQFVVLYERWSEDRQLASKQGADTAELVRLFTEQVENFKELEPNVRYRLVTSIQSEISKSSERIGEEVGKGAIHATEKIIKELSYVTEKTANTLAQYKAEIITTPWKVISATVLTTMMTSLLLVWMLIPKPTLPLTNEQLKFLNDGIIKALIWSKLSK
jgi:hypothetical protein